MPPEVTRVVALGASNLTLGLQTVLATGRAVWGADFEVLAALGYGRSYGAASRVAARSLPGILQSGLWNALRERPEAPTRGLITDVGNDILYGSPPAQILAWVGEAVDRLLDHTRAIVLTGLPVHRVWRLPPAKFLFFRSLFFPHSRVSRDQVFERVDEVNRGLAELSAARGLRLVPLRPEWYAIDPVHFRPAAWPAAWGEILLDGAATSDPAPFSSFEWARLHTFPPERRWLFGLEQATPQTGRRLRRGGRLWLF